MKKYKLSDVLAARTNDKMLKDCSPEVKRLFEDCPFFKTGCLQESGWDFNSGWLGTMRRDIYRISYDWPPAEQIEDDTKPKAPDGYRVVSMADRERCAYPSDCGVKMFDHDGWFTSGNAIGWKDEYHIPFAVPTDYKFVEDRKKERWYLNTNTMLCSSWITEPINTWFIPITAEQKTYLETKPEPEEGFDWVLKEALPSEKWLSIRGSLGSGHTDRLKINGIRWVSVPVAKKYHCNDLNRDHNGLHGLHNGPCDDCIPLEKPLIECVHFHGTGKIVRFGGDPIVCTYCDHKPTHNFTCTETWYLNGEPFDVESIKDKIERQKRDKVLKQLHVKRHTDELEHLTKRIAENEAVLAAWETAKEEVK